MPSPIGHSLTGWLTAAWRDGSFKPVHPGRFLLYVVVANGPDLDFIPGLLTGAPNLYHHGRSHSLGAGILFVCGCFLLMKFYTLVKTRFSKFAEQQPKELQGTVRRSRGFRETDKLFGKKLPWAEGATLFFLYVVHVFLDLFSMDGRPPFGVPLFWPLTENYFMVPLLPPVKHSVLDHATLGQFLTDALSCHNLLVIGLELLMVLPLALLVLWRHRVKMS